MSELIPAIFKKKLDRTDPIIKQEFVERMKKARKLAVGALSPRAVHEIRVLKMLSWLDKFGKSTIAILEGVGGSNQYGTVNTLINRKLIRSQNSKSGGFDGVPNKILTLTIQGLNYVRRHSEDTHAYKYASDSSALSMTHLYHDIVVQVLTLTEIQKGRIVSFEPEFQGIRNQIGKKRPDVIWHRSNGLSDGLNNLPLEKWAVECENTKKTSRFLHTFVSRVVDSLITTDIHDRMDVVLLITDKPGIEIAYKSAMAVGAPITDHRKDSRSRWQELPSTRNVHEEVEGRFITICKPDFLALLRPPSRKA